jgi:hypothetical protein
MPTSGSMDFMNLAEASSEREVAKPTAMPFCFAFFKIETV